MIRVNNTENKEEEEKEVGGREEVRNRTTLLYK